MPLNDRCLYGGLDKRYTYLLATSLLRFVLIFTLTVTMHR